jgi:hypothetical protein
MRSPEGVDHWTRGTFTEVIAPERLTIDHHVIDPCGGGPLFSAVTQVSFRDEGAGRTLMEVVQTYSAAGAAQADQMLKGAPEGWRQTLDKLEAEVSADPGALALSVPSSTAPFISSAPMMRRRKRCTGRCQTRRPRAVGSSGPRDGG